MEKSRFFPEINGNFGFGCMRLPMIDKDVDLKQFCDMTDAFIGAGFNYFDTAHGYIDGKSETAIRDCIAKRYPRERFLLADKLTDPYFQKEEDIRPFFMSQLELCGVDYFDFYLMHALGHTNYEKFKTCRAFETAAALKEEGLIRHIGISFHDKAEVLDMILTEQPCIEIVQIQFNYIDYDDPAVEGRKVYDVCIKHGKPIIVMEPVKGGSLVKLPEEADRILRDLGGGSNASYAVRFAASFPNMTMVLSGMSSMEQMEDNISAMKDFRPLDDTEMEAVRKVCEVFKSLDMIPCTGCKYCIEANHCPQDILIPNVFSAFNSYQTFHNWNAKFYYNEVLTQNGHGKASDCIECGCCEDICPQHLEIRDLLKQAAGVLEAEDEDD